MRLRRDLCRLIRENGDDIRRLWVERIRAHPAYVDRPEEELISTVRVAFSGYTRFICDGAVSELDQFVHFIAEKRMTLGFPLSAVQSAFEGFRVVVTPIIMAAFDKEDAINAIFMIYEAVNYAKGGFAERYQDLATRRLHEQMTLLLKEKERGEAATRLGETFLSNMSHELKTPLTIISGFSRMIAEGTAPEDKRREMGERIHLAGQKMLRMVDDLLTLTQFEAGKLPQRRDVLDLNGLLVDAAHSFAAVDREWVYDLRHHNVCVRGATSALLAAVRSLIDNGVKFSPPKSVITLSTRITDGTALLEISDRGPGVSEGNLETIFEKFRQGAEGLDRSHAGLGIGLALARAVARDHGGDVAYHPHAGGGSVFTLWLPTADVETCDYVPPPEETVDIAIAPPETKKADA